MDETQFTCQTCGGTFDKGWSDEEALAEMHTNLKPLPETATAEDRELAMLCDDCYKDFLRWATADVRDVLRSLGITPPE